MLGISMTVNFIYTCLSLCGASAGLVIGGPWWIIPGFFITFIALIVAESVFLEITKERKV